MINEIPVDAIISKYIELRDTKKAISERHKSELEPYDEALDALENELLRRMQEVGVDSFKSKEFGTAFKNSVISATCADREAFFRFVIGGEKWSLLTSAVSKEALKDFLEENDNVPPPGIDVRRVTKVQIRRPS